MEFKQCLKNMNLQMILICLLNAKIAQEEQQLVMQLRRLNVCEANNTEITEVPPLHKISNKIIAIDYDDTLSISPPMWMEIIPMLQVFGFEVCIVTYRSDVSYAWGYGTFDNSDMQWAIDICDNVIFTNGKSKRNFCAQHDIYPLIWIDDTPEAIVFTNCHDVRIQDVIRKLNNFEALSK